MNRERMIKYLKELKLLGITDTQIVRRANGSSTTLWNIRNGSISDKKLVSLWEAMDKFVDNLHELHIEASKKEDD